MYPSSVQSKSSQCDINWEKFSNLSLEFRSGNLSEEEKKTLIRSAMKFQKQFLVFFDLMTKTGNEEYEGVSILQFDESITQNMCICLESLRFGDEEWNQHVENYTESEVEKLVELIQTSKRTTHWYIRNMKYMRFLLERSWSIPSSRCFRWH